MKSDEISQNVTKICVLKYPSECNHIVRIHFYVPKVQRSYISVSSEIPYNTVPTGKIIICDLD